MYIWYIVGTIHNMCMLMPPADADADACIMAPCDRYT